MKVRAPGKVVLTGAYAVLEGSPALVVAVDRYARADSSRTAEEPSAEVREAFGDAGAPHVDTSELFREADGARKKLGLGSSAAALVASLGAELAARGQRLDDPDVRARLFARARAAHQSAQGGGSGIDVAASTYGGVLRYSLVSNRPSVLTASLPDGLAMAVYFSGESARTSDLLARVAELRASEGDVYERAMAELAAASEHAAAQAEAGTARELVVAVRAFAAALDRLGDAADVPIVPLAFRRLDVAAADEGGVFLPSGAGGGDVGVFLGVEPPSANFERRASVLGMHPLAVGIDRVGVSVTPS
jgi:phosphomevalonate kinase